MTHDAQNKEAKKSSAGIYRRDHTLPHHPSWLVLFARLSHASGLHSRNCLCRHCSSVIVICFADKLMGSAIVSQPSKRTPTDASPNVHVTCFIFHYINQSNSVNQYLSTINLLKGFWRTFKGQSENRKKKKSAALTWLFQIHFLHAVFISQLISLLQNTRSLLSISTSSLYPSSYYLSLHCLE